MAEKEVIKKILDDLSELYEIVSKIREGRGTDKETVLIGQMFSYFLLEDRTSMISALDTLEGVIRIVSYYRNNPQGSSDFKNWKPPHY